MYEILKQYAFVKEWFFDYGREDFQNLFEQPEEKEKIHMFLDPVEIATLRNDSGTTEGASYTGRFMLVLNSDLDEVSYIYRYENYISKVIAELEGIEENINCQYNGIIESWSITEVINVLSYNFDGVVVSFKVNITE